MKATYTTANGRIAFEVEAPSAKELFGELGSIQEVFDAESDCGMCHGQDIHFRVREVNKFTYYELVCMGCNARFQFGQSKDMVSLFPKRRDDGKLLANGGWSRYNPQAEEEEPAESQRGQRSAPPATERAGNGNGNGNGHGYGTNHHTDRDEAMEAELARIDRSPASATESFRKLMENLQATAGQAGLDRYDVIADQYQRDYPRGNAPKEAIKAVVRKLFTELRSFQAKGR